jgi:hypothetical protein
MRAFQMTGIDPAKFEPLFELPDHDLARLGAVRRFAHDMPGFPCRVSLEDASPGEELLLLPYVHQPASSPYHASGPIYVRRGAKQRTLQAGEVPDYVATRLISVRAYDATHMMVDASVCEGGVVAADIERMFASALVDYIHLHFARRGCFSCRVNRYAA